MYFLNPSNPSLMMAYNLSADLCVCGICGHNHATVCYTIGCTCCKASEADRLAAYMNDSMID